MWHLKTKLGTFWLVEANNDSDNRYLLGIDDHELGAYDNADLAAHDVHDQATGCIEWDCQAKIKAPDTISHWTEGSPNSWST